MAKKRTTRTRKTTKKTVSVETPDSDFLSNPNELDIDWGDNDPQPAKPKRTVRKKKVDFDAHVDVPRPVKESESDRPSRSRRTRSENFDSEERSDNGDRDRSDRNDRGDRNERNERAERPERDRGERSDRNERAERTERPERDRAERSDRNERSEGGGGNNTGNNTGGGGGGGPTKRGSRGGRRRRGGGNNANNNSGNGGNKNYRNNHGNGGNAGAKNRNRRGSQKRNPEPVEFDDVELEDCLGLLEMHPNGYGFLRAADDNYSRERSDPFVPGTMIEKFGLRAGLMIRAKVQPARRQQGPRVREVVDVDGLEPEKYLDVKNFDQLTPINPEQWYQLETGPKPLTTRVMDLLTPLGKGQRALIVAPPRSGKTIMMQHIAHGISTNYPNSKLMVLLIDERPEEVTDMRRNVDGEVIASSLDEDIESHVRLSQLVIERCKRLAEMGQDVFLLMDSITRLARAFNKWVGNTGRTMSGGVDIKAMDIPKKLFSSARAFEEGGSLTIVGTALVDTGSRMDELIFQEFKGTGNMELVLDRKLADRRVWPAIDISQSGTRREELLLDEQTLNAVTMLRRTLTTMHHIEAMEQLTRQLEKRDSNEEFIKLISGKMDNM